MIRELKEIKREQDLKNNVCYEKDADGRAIVNISVRNDDYFLSPYSVDSHAVLSSEVSNFIEDSLKIIPANESIRLRIHSNTISESEKIEYTNAIHSHYAESYKSTSFEKKRYKRIALVMAIVAILVLTVMIGLDVLGLKNAVALEIIDIVAWVFMWEAVDIFFMRCTSLSIKEKRYLRLCDSEIEYVPLKDN